MPVRSLITCALSGVAALTMLAASAGASSTIPARFAQPHATAQYRLPPPSQPLLFADVGGNVEVLNRSGNVLDSFGMCSPWGISVANNPPKLYVANGFDCDYTLIITATGSPVTLTDSGAVSDVAVDKNGNVAVSLQGGGVDCFDGGMTHPSFTIGASTFTNSAFITVDAAGNLYFDGLNSNNAGQIGEIAGGCNSPSNTVTPLTTGNTLTNDLGGIQVANNGDISVVDAGTKNIYTYAPPAGGSLGSPVATTSIPGVGDPTGFKFTPGSRDVLVADHQFGQVDLYPFPQGGIPSQFLSPGGNPYDVGLYPSEQF